MMTDDTIAAIATANGASGIAIIRVSGPQALAVADQIFQCKGARPSERQTHTIVWGRVMDADQLVDEALLLIMRAPHSYTGEDVVEFQCHGGAVTSKLVLRAALQAGARAAEAGEFTYRAFINGRMDLVQAEAVNDLIHSRSERAAKLAVEQLEGHLSRQFTGLYQRMVGVAADLEATLDFPDDELPPTVLPKIAEEISAIIASISALLASWQDGHRLREGLTVVIAGRPNVGKSSLLNALLGKERAIVSHEPGTTRDFIEEMFVVDGIPLRLIDTAGLRETSCSIEQEGVRRTRDQLKKADLYLYLLEASQPVHADDLANIAQLPDQRCLIVLNKIDLGKSADLCAFEGRPTVETSVLHSIGIDDIMKSLKTMIGTILRYESIPESVISERHYRILNKARHTLKDGLTAASDPARQVIAAHHVRQAMDLIGTITGNSATDDILSAIFSKFCVGK